MRPFSSGFTQYLTRQAECHNAKTSILPAHIGAAYARPRGKRRKSCLKGGKKNAEVHKRIYLVPQQTNYNIWRPERCGNILVDSSSIISCVKKGSYTAARAGPERHENCASADAPAEPRCNSGPTAANMRSDENETVYYRIYLVFRSNPNTNPGSIMAPGAFFSKNILFLYEFWKLIPRLYFLSIFLDNKPFK